MSKLDLAGGADDDVTPPDSDSPPAPKLPHIPHVPHVADALPPDSDSPPAPSGGGLWQRIKTHPTWIAIAIAAAGLVVTYLIWQQQTANGTAGTVTAVPATATATTTPTDTTGTGATGATTYNTDPSVLAELAALESEITALEQPPTPAPIGPVPPSPTPVPVPIGGGVVLHPMPAQRPPGVHPGTHPGPRPVPAAKGASIPHPNRLRHD